MSAIFLDDVLPWLTVPLIALLSMLIAVGWAYTNESRERIGTAGVILLVVGVALTFAVAVSYFRQLFAIPYYWAIPLILMGSTQAFIGLRLVLLATTIAGSKLAGALHSLGFAWLIGYLISHYGVRPSPLIDTLQIVIFGLLAISAIFFLLFLLYRWLAWQKRDEKGKKSNKPINWITTLGAIAGLILALIKLAQQLNLWPPWFLN